MQVGFTGLIGRQIVIADFLEARDTNQVDGVYSAEVEVVKVLQGTTKLGRAKVETIYPMTKGRRYLLYSLADAPDFQAFSELSVVELPEREPNSAARLESMPT